MEFYSGMELRIDKAGRIVVPKVLRERFGFDPDTELEALELADGVLIKRAEDRPSMVKVDGLWTHQGVPQPKANLDRVLDEVREERRERRGQQLRFLKVGLAVRVSGHPAFERHRNVHKCPRVAVLVRRFLERGKVQAEPSLILGRINGHPHPLRPGEILLPGQRNEATVGVEKLIDIAHSNRPW